ncbi:MAG: ABC transporter ATP-binding protein [Hyphomicrobiaceae bacterium]
MMLDTRDITVNLAGRLILERVSCRAQAGKITAVIGPNGAGKSTLLRAMAGLLPLEAGSIDFDGRALHSLERTELARSIAYLPQERIVHWPLAVERVVALGRLPYRAGMMPDARDHAAVDAAMHTMDVSGLAHRPVSQLSGGERARVLVARALAQESRVLIADEPTAGLDPAHALGLFGTFGQLAAEGRAVIVALHDLTLAARFCHHVVLLVAGRVAADGPAADVLQPAPLSAAFGVTIANGLVADVPVVLAVAPLP